MTKHVMKLYKWDEVIKSVDDLIGRGIDCYQQFNCRFCGAKQTMDRANSFHETGICEECGKTTDIKHDGCNYMIHGKGPAVVDALLRDLAGKK